MIALKLNTSKIDQARLFKGKTGLLADLVLIENREGKDQYGNDGFICHSTTKAERDAGVKGAIVGNWKHLEAAPKADEGLGF